MKIAVLKEHRPGELRVSATADTVKKYNSLGFSVAVENDAGLAAGIRDEAYAMAGATLASKAECLMGANLVLKVMPPTLEEIQQIPEGAALFAILQPYDYGDYITQYTARRISAFAMDLMPRISRAQSMDVLSSQSNLTGYRAVIEGVAALRRVVPMMMTAAGTVSPAKVLVLGAGVAGLQAIATAKRLGAVVSAFDVRPAVKEQVESLGAKFIQVPAEEEGEAQGGYAREMSEDYKRKQSALIHETLKTQDLAITTALIPGKPAPTLITEAMVKDMKEGSVIVDIAVMSGGNCPLSKADSVVEAHGVKILAPSNIPSLVAADATALYARNLYSFIAELVKDKCLIISLENELVKGTLLTHAGEIKKSEFIKGE